MPDPQPVATEPRRRPRSRWLLLVPVLVIESVLVGVPAWTLLQAQGPTAVTVVGGVVLTAAFVGLPVLMVLGHGRGRDGAAVAGDALLGAMWVLFTWSVIGQVVGLLLLVAGVADPMRSRGVAVAVAAVVVLLLVWGYTEAMRVPRLRHVEVALSRLGRGLDGLRVAIVTDTHFGPIDRSRWTAGVVDRVNALDADVVCLVGDIADGTAQLREPQARPLADLRARMARVYVTGNHEYISEAQGWLEYMAGIGWDTLHNRHLVIARDGSQLVIAGVDDATASGSGVDGHGADLDAALADTDPSTPILLLAHQPKQVGAAVAASVDLQISGHTHGGQIWPFNFLVRLDQPVVQGLSAHGERTQLYTSRGTGFWGPPFRVFAPSEITVMTLRSA